MTTAGEACSIEVVVAAPDTAIADAARLMRDHHVGTVVVVQSTDGARRPLGIVTDRDMVVEVMAMDIDPRAVTVSDVMAPALVTVRDDQDIRDTLALMRYKGVRRVPVIDLRGRLVGILASDDLVRVLADDMATLALIGGREHDREAAQRKPVSS